MIVINFIQHNDTIVFADILKGEDFIKSLSKRDISEGKIIIMRI